MTAIQSPAPPASLSERTGFNPWLIAVVVSMATFMEVLDTSIANVALPHIAGNLSASQDEATWVLTSYLVANAIILPISGWLATVIGRKRFYMTCVALFAVSSFLCGIAPNLPLLIFFRVLQGMGGGGLAPSEQAILTDTFPPQEARDGVRRLRHRRRRRAGGRARRWAGGSPTTPPGGGSSSSTCPSALLSLFLSHLVVTGPAGDGAAAEADARAAASGSTTSASPWWRWGWAASRSCWTRGRRRTGSAPASSRSSRSSRPSRSSSCVFWELHIREPIVDLPLLKDRTFLVSNIIMFMVGFILFGSTVLIPQFLQVMMGYTATDAGLAITPGGFFVMLLMPLVGHAGQQLPGQVPDHVRPGGKRGRRCTT